MSDGRFIFCLTVYVIVCVLFINAAEAVIRSGDTDLSSIPPKLLEIMPALLGLLRPAVVVGLLCASFFSQKKE